MADSTGDEEMDRRVAEAFQAGCDQLTASLERTAEAMHRLAASAKRLSDALWAAHLSETFGSTSPLLPESPRHSRQARFRNPDA